MVSAADIDVINDQMYINLKVHKLAPDQWYYESNQPKRTTLKLTTAEYKEFVSQFDFWNSVSRKHLN